jgi:hypothetical protein
MRFCWNTLTSVIRPRNQKNKPQYKILGTCVSRSGKRIDTQPIEYNTPSDVMFNLKSDFKKPVIEKSKLIDCENTELLSYLNNINYTSNGGDMHSFDKLIKVAQAKRIKQEENRKNKQKISIDKSLSKRSASKIQGKLRGWFQTVNEWIRINDINIPFTFVTLTFIDEIHDYGDYCKLDYCLDYDKKTKVAKIYVKGKPKIIKAATDHQRGVKMLNQLLTHIRQEIPDFSYLWVAELQEKNNNRLHFHLITNKDWDLNLWRERWWKIQVNYGLKPSKRKNSQEYNKTSCFQAHYIKNFRKLGCYISKYVTKNRSLLTCQVWNCSKKISRLGTGEVGNEDLFNEILNSPNNYYDKIDIETGEVVSTRLAEMQQLDFGDFIPIYNLNYLDRLQELIKWNCYVLFVRPLQQLGNLKSIIEIPDYNYV